MNDRPLKLKSYITDCEGPISLNDNALELTAEFIPGGDSFYAKISRYDDYLADVAHKPGYKAGDTLRLILPFLKAYGVTGRMMADFSADHVDLVPDAAAALAEIGAGMDTFIISTSYAPYVKALCELVGVPFSSAYCTAVDIDAYLLDEADAAPVRAIKDRLDGLPEFDLPPGVTKYEELPADTKKAIGELDRVFWDELPGMRAGVLLTAADPVGGAGKARALEDALLRTGQSMSDIIYVGDSITDVQALRAVSDGGGLAVSFNGNRYAVEAADVAMAGTSVMGLVPLAKAFLDGGKKGVCVLLDDLTQNIMNDTKLREAAVIDETNRESLIAISEAVRREIRGKAGNIG